MQQLLTRLRIVSQYPPTQSQKDHPLIETTKLSGVKSGLHEEVPAFMVLTEESWALLDRKCTVRGLLWSNMLKNGNRVGGGEGACSPPCGVCARTAAFEERAGLAPTRGSNRSLDKVTFITLQAVLSSSHWSSFSCDLELWAPPCHRY